MDQAMAEPGTPHSLTGTSIGRFRVCERLGAGGMGEVYRAEDTKLNRSVAVKRMADSLRSDLAQRKRFIKEAERVSQLMDPNIAALFDILEENDEIFLVMELIDGSNIRDHFQNHTSLKEFLKAAICVAEGLRTAHAQRIIHCDIKPENIMISNSGQVKLLDFGLARQIAKPGSYVTYLSGSTGVSGTPGYMAPEVMLEETPVAQSDIFSFGVVLYEILSGTHPFRKRTMFETADAVLHNEPPKLEDLGIQRPLSRVIAKMMAKERGERYQSADELIPDLQDILRMTEPDSEVPRSARVAGMMKPSVQYLKRHRRIGIAVLILTVILAAVIVTVRNSRGIGRALGLSKAPLVAVLPFQNIGSAPSGQAFTDGLSYVVTSELTQLTDRYAVQVVPASEIRSENIHSAKAARQVFGVDLTVEGSLQQVANMLRVTYNVVDARTGRQVKAGSISTPAGDPLGLQDQLASSIASSLGVDVKANDRDRLVARGTTVSAAYDNYLQGLGYMEDYQKAENLDAAISAFNQALHYDSAYALVYAGLGEAHWHKYSEQSISSELSDASLACQRALAIEPGLAEGYRCLGNVYISSGKYQEAAQQLELAVAKRPTDDGSVRALGTAYEKLHQFNQAEATYRRAIDLRPHYWAGYSWLGAYYAKRGQYENALKMFERVIAIAPDNYRGYNNAGGIYILLGDFGKAIGEFEKSVPIRPSFGAYSNLGTAYFFQRRYADAVAAYTHAVQLNQNDCVILGNLADAQYFTPGQRELSAKSYMKAIELAKRQLDIDGKDADTLGRLAVYNAMLGRRKEAKDLLSAALAIKRESPDMWWRASVVYSQEGDAAQTLLSLQSALAAGFSSVYITSAPYFDNLRSDPRYQQLIRSAKTLEQH
jgi:serine/threonine protein kinase/tetratricopeptide (TPR) repeat protein